MLSFSCAREIKDFYNTDDNNKMYYESYGSGESVIVFIHGWSVTCRSWDDQIDFFKNKFKVILIDLPGFGKSEHNMHTPDNLTTLRRSKLTTSELVF